MADSVFDFAVFGSGPPAGLIAGLLAEAHNRQVCLIGEPYSRFRLRQVFHMSTAPLTRAETWALLAQTENEGLALLSRIGGKSAIERLEAIYLADSAAATDGLQHSVHMATACGMGARKHGARMGPDTRTVYRFGPASTINCAVFEPALVNWLVQLGVRMIDRRDAVIAKRRDGSIGIEIGTATFDAAQMILADDAAIAAHAQIGPEDRRLRLSRATAMLVRTGRALPEAHLHYLDRGVELRRAGPNTVAAIVDGSGDGAEAALGSCLAAQAPLEKIGEASFTRVVSIDGAPIVGALPGSKAVIIAGLAPFGVFLAPALARFIAGQAHEGEARYFEARAVGRGNARLAVAEFAPGVTSEVAP